MEVLKIRLKNGENVPYLEIAKLVLIHCNSVANSYLQSFIVVYTFAPNKSLGQLLDITVTHFISFNCIYLFLYVFIFVYF